MPFFSGIEITTTSTKLDPFSCYAVDHALLLRQLAQKLTGAHTVLCVMRAHDFYSTELSSYFRFQLVMKLSVTKGSFRLQFSSTNSSLTQ